MLSADLPADENDEVIQARQTAEEERIIANLKVCKVSNTGNLTKLNAAVLGAKLSEDFYSASLLEALQCFFEVELHAAKDKGPLTLTKDVHQHLTKPHRIGAESVEGVALLTGINDIDDLVIIKAPRNPEADGLLHEYFVAVTCLNSLRRRVPGFMYAFGAFRCSAPVIDGKKVVQWCTPKQPSVNYVVFEKINGKDLKDLMPTLTLDEVISYFIQVAINEQVAVETCSWTHNDLHSGNVLCRQVPHSDDPDTTPTFDPETWFYVPFSMAGDRMLYIKSNRVATFIDYGRAHVKYRGKHYGFHNRGLREEDGLLPNKARPLYDMYKLLGFCLYDLFNEKGKSFTPKSPAARELFRQLQPLFSFFRDTDGPDGKPDYVKYLSMVKDERDTFYVYSVAIEEWEQRSSIQDLLAYIEQHYPDQWRRMVSTTVGADDLVLTCSGVIPEVQEESTPCDSPKDAVQAISFNLVKGRNSTVVPKQAEQVITEVANTRKRIQDITAMRGDKGLDTSIEYRAALDANSRSERLLRENYPKLRNELKERIVSLVQQLRLEGELYTGLRYTSNVHATAKENDSELKRLIKALEDSHLRLIFALVKAYTVSEVALSELEYLAKERNPTAKRALLPKELAILSKRIVKEAGIVEGYLEQLQPLSKEGKVLRDALRNTIDLGM